MFKKYWFLFLVLLIEGAALMSVELMGAKLVMPFYGSSLYVWTAVLTITVLGLTAGYYLGGRLSEKKPSGQLLSVVLFIAALLVLALPYTAQGTIAATKTMGLIPGICITGMVLLLPPMLCFGIVGPMVVRLMTSDERSIGKTAGTVYFTSTLGGIVATFFLGFYFIPEVGLKMCSLVTGLSLSILPILFLAIRKNVNYTPSITSTSETSSKTRTTNKGNEIKSSIYLFSALEGATVMAVELMAARMIAPYFGSSLHVWGAVIGFTLLGLAIGYYTGGYFADKYPGLKTMYWVLFVASVFLVLMHWMAQHLTMLFIDIDPGTAVIIVSFLLVVPPLVCLGMVPTLLIKYVSTRVDDAGAATGKVYTISAASGIVIMPILGFMVIPAAGLTNPSIFIGLLVGIVPFLQLIRQKKYLVLALPAILVLSIVAKRSKQDTDTVEVQYYSEGLLGQLLVADINKNDAGQQLNDRMLFLNRIGQTYIDKSTYASKWNYPYYITSLVSIMPEKSDALLLGLGGGSIANLMADNLGFNLDVVELDERIRDIAQQFFRLTSKANVIVDDARHYLAATDKTYDIIFFDLYRGDSPPAHVLTRECLEKTKQLLKKNGLIIINFNGFTSGKTGQAFRSVYKTMIASGLNTRVFPTPGNELERNNLIVGSIAPPQFNKLRSPLTLGGAVVNIDSLSLDMNSIPLSDAIVLTDDKPILDLINMDAGKQWRKSYVDFISLFYKHGVPLFK